MQHHFYAYMARMKLIKRWGLRHNTREENDQEHSLQVTMIAHALAMYKNRRYGGNVDVEKVLLYAIYHEAAEVITGDLASPIKYFNPGIRDAYKAIEHMASEKLMDYLPEDFKGDFQKLLFPDEQSYEWRIVKAADRIAAYLKCVEEIKSGNGEFADAKESIRQDLEDSPLEEVAWFMERFAPSFELTLDKMKSGI